jgi:hypothetical protein
MDRRSEILAERERLRIVLDYLENIIIGNRGAKKEEG